MMAQTSVALSWHNEYFLPSLFVSSTNAVHRLTHAALIGSDGDDFPLPGPQKRVEQGGDSRAPGGHHGRPSPGVPPPRRTPWGI